LFHLNVLKQIRDLISRKNSGRLMPVESSLEMLG